MKKIIAFLNRVLILSLLSTQAAHATQAELGTNELRFCSSYEELEQRSAVVTIDGKINAVVEPATEIIDNVVFYGIELPTYLSEPKIDSISAIGFADPVACKKPTKLPIVLVWLLVAAAIFTIYFRFVNLRGIGQALRIVRGKYDDPSHDGEVTHFQALSAALSGTVGLGNIAGVAVAISLGGPGATFWMILVGFLGMSSKFVECTLGVKYRTIGPDGVVSGGPMHYLRTGLADRGWPVFGKILAIFFAVMCIGGSFGGGNMFQANQAYAQFHSVAAEFGFDGHYGWIFGSIIAVFVGLVIIGGIRSIGRVTRILVPFMCIIYVLAGLFIILGHITDVPAAFEVIVTSAFDPDSAPKAVGGGLIGVLIQGIQRAAFSNEAGVGSAAIAHSAVKTNEPVSEGLVALLEPFIDTIVVCTITALVVIITGAHIHTGMEGIEMTSRAFNSIIPGFDYILVVAVVLFAFSTMITWSYYGLKSWTYLFGDSKAMDLTYKLLFLLFVVIGSAMNLGAVIGFSDAMIFAMSFGNIIGLYIMMPEVKRDLNGYLSRVASGEIRETQ